MLLIFIFGFRFSNASWKSLLNRLIKIIPASFRLRFLKIADITVFLLFFVQSLLSCCGDIKENPGPKYSPLTFCHWNLNGLTARNTAHDSTKISLFQAYITQLNYGIICLTETFLNSSIPNDDNRITIDGYSLIRSDSSNFTRWYQDFR